MTARPRRPWYRSYYPGWFVSGGGGGGGASTVQTDGVTLQGDGSAGNNLAIKAVQLAARLTGAGTVASPLDVAGWPITAFFSGNRVTPQTAATNQTRASGFTLPAALTFSHIGVEVTALDAGNLYDFGLYNAAGTLIANIGAQALPASGFLSFATVQGAQTISPGFYVFAFTGNAATGAIRTDGGNSLISFSSQSYHATAGGALAPSVTAFTIAPSINAFCFLLF